ncbi:unnamed protein product [Cunninghamella echinulata]
MSDLSWCISCDRSINPYSDSLYCSEKCLYDDSLRNNPLLGYTYPELTDFPRPSLPKRPSFTSIHSTCSSNNDTSSTLSSSINSSLCNNNANNVKSTR